MWLCFSIPLPCPLLKWNKIITGIITETILEVKFWEDKLEEMDSSYRKKALSVNKTFLMKTVKCN